MHKLEAYVLKQFGDEINAVDFNRLSNSVGLQQGDKMFRNDFVLAMLKRLGKIKDKDIVVRDPVPFASSAFLCRELV